MTSTPNWEPIRLPVMPTATRYKANRNWSFRNSGRKPKDKK